MIDTPVKFYNSADAIRHSVSSVPPGPRAFPGQVPHLLSTVVLFGHAGGTPDRHRTK